MAQVINTNVPSLNAQRNLSSSANQLGQALTRLSSGLRINSAKDDAAGLAISDRFSTQIRGLDQAVRNANDGISLSQTAEGALAEITSNLQRIRELAVQSANATNSASDRDALNQEVQQRLAEIDRVSSQTSFNSRKILDGSFGNATFQVGANVGQTISLDLQTSTRLSKIGAIASTQTNALGATAAGGSITVANTSLAFGTAGTPETNATLALSPASSLFGTAGAAQIDGSNTVAITFGDFSTAGNAGANISTADTSALVVGGGSAITAGTGATYAQFEVTDGTTVVGITLAAANGTGAGGTYANTAELAADIQAQLQAVDATYTAVDAGAGVVEITRVGDFGGGSALVIQNADVNAVAGGIAGAGVDGVQTTNVEFDVDGTAVTLTANNASNANVAADLTAALTAAFGAGVYAVTDNTDGTFDITNVGNTTAVAIVADATTDARANAGAAGIVSSAGTTGTPQILANATTFQIDGFNVTLDQNYASFDALADDSVAAGGAGGGFSIFEQLEAQSAGTYSVANAGGVITITNLTTGGTSLAPDITGADAAADAAGFGNTDGVSTNAVPATLTTNAAFSVDGQAISLAPVGDYADVAALVTDLQGQLDTAFGANAYTAAAAGASPGFSITNNTIGSDAVVISGSDANATAAGIVNATGTDGAVGGSFTLATGEFTVGGVDFAGDYTSASGLADEINRSLSDVSASVTSLGEIAIRSTASFDIGGTGSLGIAAGQINASGELSTVGVGSVEAANDAIVRIDSALQSVSTLRSTFGAVQNRFESTITNLQTTSENLAASRSRILDADFAQETANLTRAQILQQAGVAILSQANQLPQNVLSLLR